MIVSMLLRFGADPTKMCEEGSVIELAEQKGLTKLHSLLKSYARAKHSSTARLNWQNLPRISTSDLRRRGTPPRSRSPRHSHNSRRRAKTEKSPTNSPRDAVPSRGKSPKKQRGSEKSKSGSRSGKSLKSKGKSNSDNTVDRQESDGQKSQDSAPSDGKSVGRKNRHFARTPRRPGSTDVLPSRSSLGVGLENTEEWKETISKLRRTGSQTYLSTTGEVHEE